MSDSSSSSSVSSSDTSSAEEPVEEQAEVEEVASAAADEASRQSAEADQSAEKASEAAASSGNDDESDEDVVIRKKKPPVDASDLFGDLSDDDDDDESGSEKSLKRGGDDEEDNERVAEGEEAAEVEEGAEEPGIVERIIQVEMPSVRFDLGNDLFYVRLPNFLSIDPKPFDPETYLGECGDEEVLDEEGRTRLKMSVENTIRWQQSREVNEDGEEVIKRQSNARIVKWSDGSMSLHLGSEIFDIHVMPEQQDYNHMYVKQGNGLVGQAVFRKKLVFRPHSTDSLTHRKMTLSMADKSTRVQQVKEMHLGRLKNPEMNKAQLIKQEEDALKATVRRESQQRKVRDRFSIRSLEQGLGGEDEEGAISLSSIKRRVMNKPRTSRDDDFIDDDYDSSSADERAASEEEEAVGESSLTASAKAKKRRLVVNDD